MASEGDTCEVSPPDMRKKTLQDLLEFIRSSGFGEEDRSKTADPSEEARHVWHGRFDDYFVKQDRGDADDLLFFVKEQQAVASGRRRKSASQSKDGVDADPVELAVCRKDAKNTPRVDDALVRWNETVYLNLIMQDFDYTLTLAICSADPKSVKPLDVFNIKSQRVYATPSLQRMDKKGKTSSMTYPLIYFTIDNFEEVFSDLAVLENQKVVVQLTAFKPAYDALAVPFLGSVKYSALKTVFDAKESAASKLASKASLGLWSSSQKRTEFVGMRGPRGCGRAQMAVNLNYVAASNGESSSAKPDQSSSSSSALRWLRGSKASTNAPGTSISYRKTTAQQPDHDDSMSTSTGQVSKSSSSSTATAAAAGESNIDDGGTSTQNGSTVSSDSDFPDSEIINEEDCIDAANDAVVEVHSSPARAEVGENSGFASRTLSWLMAPVSAVTQRASERSVCELSARLTYVMLPWHAILREILRPERQPALPFHLDS